MCYAMQEMVLGKTEKMLALQRRMVTGVTGSAKDLLPDERQLLHTQLGKLFVQAGAAGARVRDAVFKLKDAPPGWQGVSLEAVREGLNR
jgi:hypothetical protein